MELKLTELANYEDKLTSVIKKLKTKIPMK